MKKLILASASPRRQELLRQIGVPFDVITEDFDESMDNRDAPGDVVMELARRKAALVCDKYSFNAIVLAADTLVWRDGMIFGKPANDNEAFSILSKLQGGVHCVYTGVCIIDGTGEGGSVKCFAEHARVSMRAASETDILAYIGTGEPFGKAGAYAVQGKGSFLIEGISGDYFTVVGLPLMRVCLALRELGFEVTRCW